MENGEKGLQLLQRTKQIISIEPGSNAIWLSDKGHWSFKYLTRTIEFPKQQI